MASSELFERSSNDPVLAQAETIFAQRQARALVLDREILGEPGWDLLLYAFIAQRKGTVCSLDEAARDIGLSLPTTTRWVDLLALRAMMVRQGQFFAIGEEIETKLTALFTRQISEALDMLRSMRRSGSNGAKQQQ